MSTTKYACFRSYIGDCTKGYRSQHRLTAVEQGVAMLSSVLNSKRAVSMHKDLAQKLMALED
jgi:hypothetical protein